MTAAVQNVVRTRFFDAIASAMTAASASLGGQVHATTRRCRATTTCATWGAAGSDGATAAPKLQQGAQEERTDQRKNATTPTSPANVALGPAEDVEKVEYQSACITVAM